MTYLNGASWRLFWCDIECSAVTLTSSIANRLQYCRPSWCHVWITPLCRAQTDIQPNNIIKKRNNKKVEIFKLGHDNRTAWTDERQPNNKRPRLYGYNIVVSSCFAYGRHSNISFSKQSRNTKKQNVECHPTDVVCSIYRRETPLSSHYPPRKWGFPLLFQPTTVWRQQSAGRAIVSGHLAR